MKRDFHITAETWCKSL